MNVTAADIIAALEGIDPDTPIQIAFQPSWPLTAQITRIAADTDGTLTIEGFGQEGYYQSDDEEGNLLNY